MLFKLWEKVNKMPKFKYINTNDNAEDKIYGYIYLLDGNKYYYEINNNLIIDDFIYGINQSKDLEDAKSLIRRLIFSKTNISKVLLKDKIIAFNENTGFLLNQKEKIKLYDIFKNAKEVDSSKEISALFEGNNTPLYIIRVFDNDSEFLTINIYNEKYFSVYYLDSFLYLLKGNLLSFLKKPL
nr:DUF3919 family protein [Marinitoga lauensis]